MKKSTKLMAILMVVAVMLSAISLSVSADITSLYLDNFSDSDLSKKYNPVAALPTVEGGQLKFDSSSADSNIGISKKSFSPALGGRVVVEFKFKADKAAGSNRYLFHMGWRPLIHLENGKIELFYQNIGDYVENKWYTVKAVLDYDQKVGETVGKCTEAYIDGVKYTFGITNSDLRQPDFLTTFNIYATKNSTGVMFVDDIKIYRETNMRKDYYYNCNFDDAAMPYKSELFHVKPRFEDGTMALDNRISPSSNIGLYTYLDPKWGAEIKSGVYSFEVKAKADHNGGARYLFHGIAGSNSFVFANKNISVGPKYITPVYEYDTNKWYKLKMVVDFGTTPATCLGYYIDDVRLQGDFGVLLNNSSTMKFFAEALKVNETPGIINIDDMVVTKLLDSDFTYSDTVVKDNWGFNMDTLPADTEITATVNACNNSLTDKSFSILLGLYDKTSGKLTSVQTYNKTLSIGEQTDIVTDIFTTPKDAQNYKLKVFAWDGLSGLKPYNPAKILE